MLQHQVCLQQQYENVYARQLNKVLRINRLVFKHNIYWTLCHIILHHTLLLQTNRCILKLQNFLPSTKVLINNHTPGSVTTRQPDVALSSVQKNLYCIPKVYTSFNVRCESVTVVSVWMEKSVNFYTDVFHIKNAHDTLLSVLILHALKY